MLTATNSCCRLHLWGFELYAVEICFGNRRLILKITDEPSTLLGAGVIRKYKCAVSVAGGELFCPTEFHGSNWYHASLWNLVCVLLLNPLEYLSPNPCEFITVVVETFCRQRSLGHVQVLVELLQGD